MKIENCKLGIDGSPAQPVSGWFASANPFLQIARLAILASFIVINTVSFAAHPEADEPWPELDPKSPRLSFADAAFRDADADPRSLSQSQLTRWLAPVPGQNHRFFEAPRGKGLVAGYEGLVRLRAPWP